MRQVSRLPASVPERLETTLLVHPHVLTRFSDYTRFLAVADGALTGIRGRPMALKRFVDGAEAEPL